MKLFDTGELDILDAAERGEAQAVRMAKYSTKERAKALIRDHPIASAGIAGAAVGALALLAKTRIPTKALSVPLRLAATTLIGATMTPS